MKFRHAVVVMLSLVAGIAAAESVSQGSGSTTVTPWSVNNSAIRGGKTSEVCITNAAGGTTLNAVQGRRAVELQNLGPNPIYCTVDGQTPLATGALGRKIAAAADAPSNVWSLDAGAIVTIKCIAGVAAQATPACTMLTELK